MSTATNSPPPKPPSKPTGGKPVKPAKKSSTIPPAPPTNIVGTTAPQNTTSMPSNRSPPKKAAKPTTPPKSSNPFDDDDDNHDSCDNNNSNNSNGNGSDARRGGGSRGGDVAMTSFVNPVAAATSTTSTANNSNNSNLLKNKNINSKKVMNYNYNAKASKIYDKVNVAEFWILVFVVVEVLQCSTLVHVGRSVLPQGIYIFLWVLTFTIALCCVLGRVIIKRKPYFNWLKEPNSPEDETEQNLTVVSIYLFCIAAILEGVFFAIFSAVVAGNDTALPPSGNGYTNRETLLETLRFASITLLFLHRIIRPANRLDPARTMLEVS